MTFLPTSLIGANDDYVEEVRGYLYPRIHGFLTEYTPAYGVGTVTDNTYVGTITPDEETIEKELQAAGLVRNPIACFKRHADGRESEGSWVLLPERNPGDYVSGPSRQLHITLMPRRGDKPGVELYAHDEYDWRDYPMRHLRGVDFKPQVGVANARRLVNSETYFDLKDFKR